MAGIFQRFLRREPITVLKIELNGNRFTLDRLSKENNIVHDTLREVSYMAPDSIPIRPSREAQEELQDAEEPEAMAEEAEALQAQPVQPGAAQEEQLPEASAPVKKGVRARLLARQARQQAEEGEAWQMPGSTIFELRSNINIKKGQIMKIQLLDAQKGCSVSLRRSPANEFIEWYGDPFLYGSVFSSGILQTVLQRKARLGTLVLVFIIAFILGGICLGGLI